MDSTQNGKLMIIDGNSLMHRAFHALPPMNAADGTPTQAIYGFLNMLFRIVGEEQPSHLLIAFDTHAPTPRHIAYSEYKAGRKATPDELRKQLSLIRDVLSSMHIAVGEQDGWEADDFLGIFSRRGEAEGFAVRLVTGDRDALQLVTDQTYVILTRKGITETQVYDPAAIREQYGMEPEGLIELKGLMGDSSDNIPGIPGVGEKTALKLIHAYGTVEGTIAHADEISGAKLREKIVTFADQARLSRQIGIVQTDKDAPIQLTIADCRFERGQMADGREMLSNLGLRTLVKRLPKAEEEKESKPQASMLPQMQRVEIRDCQALAAAYEQMQDKPCLAVAWTDNLSLSDGHTVWTVFLQKDLLETGLNQQEALDGVLPLLTDKHITKRLYHVKQWKHRVWKHDQSADLSVECFDAMIAAYLLMPSRTQYTETELAEQFLGTETYDAGALFYLCAKLEEKLREQSLQTLFDSIETPLISVLAGMEREGFLIDQAVLHNLGDQYSASIDALKQEIYELAGEPFNILSPKQLGSVLFDKLKLPVQRKTKTGYSTDAETLDILADQHPIVKKVLEYRQNTKLKSTYIDGLLTSADKEGRVHSQFHQTVTATGRISSSEPNLQNIPVRTEMGREIRRAFISREGFLLVGADYSQIELRVLAHMANDDKMIEAFVRGEDIHASTAAQVAGCSIHEVTSEMRSAAKATNFGIVYGISDFGLSRQLGIPRRQAADYIAAYLEKYQGVRQYMRDVVEQGKRDGYVCTLFDRRRDLPELKSSNYNTRSFGERAAMNAPIQGTAADIIKLAMIRTVERLQEARLRAKLILQIHDELIVESPAEEAEQVGRLLKEAMEGVTELRAPLVADVRSGRSWYETK